MTRTLLITEKLSKQLLEPIQQLLSDWRIIASTDRDVWQQEAPHAEIIAGWHPKLSAALEGSTLRWIQAWSAGVNSLPLATLQQRHTILTNAVGVHAYPISETIFALMLGLTRNLHTYVSQQREKRWHHGNLKLELHGKTLGMLGVGAIGSETAKIAKAFGMTVLGYRHSGQRADHFDHMYTTDELHQLLPQCDYVVAALPSTEATQQLFGEKEFALMKQSAFLINVGRGDLIDEGALVHALQNGTILGAGLDVFAVEPLPQEHPFWNMPNVILTPHTAGSTEHYNERVVHDIFLPNLQNYLNDASPNINVVDYSKGY
ncbi:NAD-binding D-isomer specific 2-hydroxyacid dehydrogenase protein [Fictibacillus macauensis ZFHKF-1]|uniref:NAD-binding D-isomer specific 2-hydroxyacid dehydrogenase protein n=1 Tax=Fictibacillus macauensis ZFHKF-1 TaxID=1196324 RepID=I8AKA5_9BACL|nr:D-2-hydroxyacid dehydrogenase [Fictibacillus macauensis]EIT86282.1 NAD-binding D-isomer specific 2-hydroxyacid dehydrogenase protein [Fictibacillus macauensis ZFHKF-1]